MRGSLRKRSKNAWTIIVDLEKDPAGKRRQKWLTVKGTKRDAERKLIEIIAEINSQIYITPSQEALGAYLKSGALGEIRTHGLGLRSAGIITWV